MVRKAKKKPIETAKMYRHFAAVTIGVTALVGVLADGEAQQAVEERQAAREEKKRLKEAEVLNRGNRVLISDSGSENIGRGSFGSDVSMGNMGSGYSSSNASNVRAPRSERDALTRVPIWERVGLTKEAWEGLTEAQQNELAEKLDPLHKMTAAQVRAERKKGAEAARIRAGGRGSGGADAPN